MDRLVRRQTNRRVSRKNKKKQGKKGKGKEKDSGDGASRPKKSKKAAVDVPELTQEQIAEAEALATVSTSSCMILMNEADELFTG